MIGDKLLRLRQNTGESLQDVAASTGVSRAHIWDVETGRTRNPSLDFVSRMAAHFKTSVGWLVGETAEEGAGEVAALYRSLHSLSPDNLEHVRAIVDSMLKDRRD